MQRNFDGLKGFIGVFMGEEWRLRCQHHSCENILDFLFCVHDMDQTVPLRHSLLGLAFSLECQKFPPRNPLLPVKVAVSVSERAISPDFHRFQRGICIFSA
jgi:hypothetical protein